MKTHTFVRSTWWDDDVEYDVFNRVGGDFNGTIHTEARIYMEVLMYEGIVWWNDIPMLESLTLMDLERMCLDNNIYIIIEDEKES